MPPWQNCASYAAQSGQRHESQSDAGRTDQPAGGAPQKHGLIRGGEVIVEDAGDAIVLRTLDQVVARAQALSRKLLKGQAGSTVDDFLADREREAE